MSSSTATNSLSAVLSDPLHVSLGLFIGLILFVFYLLLPRGVRKQYFGAYPKRHVWSARSRQQASSLAGSATQNARRSLGGAAGAVSAVKRDVCRQTIVVSLSG